MAYTEFHVSTSGSNLNAGSTILIVADVTETNGDWDNATANAFTASAGTPFSGVSVGEFASVYLDGASVAVYVARITAVGGGGASVTLSTAADAGTAPTSGAAGRSCKVGGAWKGPNGAEAFPFGFVTNVLKNSTGNPPRINFKGGVDYDVTANITHNLDGGCTWEGYTTSIGDGGKATIDGGTVETSYILFSFGNSAHANKAKHIIFSSNGASGTASGVTSANGNTVCFEGCKFTLMGGDGFESTGGAMCWLIGCLAEGNNISNTATQYGIRIDLPGWRCVRCWAKDNTTANTSGFLVQNAISHCIASGNGAHGFVSTGNQAHGESCDAYNNGGSGWSASKSAVDAGNIHIIENSNFFKNGAYGIAHPNDLFLFITNCGFGAGTEANTSGDIEANEEQQVTGKVTHTTNENPWNDAASDDFNITHADSKDAGDGSFYDAVNVAHLDIGAVQHEEVAVAAGGISSRTINSFHSSVFS